MSRIGKQQLNIPATVKVLYKDRNLTISGPNGTLTLQTSNLIGYKITNTTINLFPTKTTKKTKSIWGLSRSLVNNMIIGVSQGFSKKLEVNGVGYKAHVKQDLLILTLGFSHDIIYPIPQHIIIKCFKNIIEISGCDKQLIGQISADIRSMRKPEPYNGKGIRYMNELIIKKEGKKK